MRRRLTWAIVGTVVVTLVVVGVGTLVLARIDARSRTIEDLERRAVDVADAVAELPEGREVDVLRRLRGSLDLDGVTLVRLGVRNPVGPRQPLLPAGVELEALDAAALRAGAVVSGVRGSTAYAAAAVPDRVGSVALPVVVVTNGIASDIGPAGRWFVLAGVVTVAVAAVVARRLGRALAGPVAEAEATTRRIAAGDLAARVPAPAEHADDELARLARSINTMAEELERSRGLERQFLLSVSHDLRTPLTSIRGWAEAIADGAAEEPAVAAGVVVAESRRLERLVRDLLDLARLDARRFSLDVGDVDLADVAAGTAEGMRPDLEDAGLQVRVEGDGRVPVAGDADRLAQVAANLLENAGKFARSTITVRAVLDGDDAVLQVDDDGPGIDAEDLPHVFERLYVARRRPLRAESGSGLGLAIVRELTTAMGGRVAAGPAPGGGARLEVRLPAVR
jgi:two-component system sensor histidine kinase BaeS